MVEVEQKVFNFWSLILQALTAAGLIYFAWRQHQINKRMQELADYVAVFITPMPNSTLQIKNVGRSNLYLHKWEIGSLSETYVKPWILPTGEGSQILIATQPQAGQHLSKFYFTDEKDIKYLSIGEVVMEPVEFQLPPSTTPPQTQADIPQNQVIGAQSVNIQIKLRMRAWAYKTEKYDWTI
jgi:hypothetical protein